MTFNEFLTFAILRGDRVEYGHPTHISTLVSSEDKYVILHAKNHSRTVKINYRYSALFDHTVVLSTEFYKTTSDGKRVSQLDIPFDQLVRFYLAD